MKLPKTAAFEQYRKAIPYFLEAEKANPPTPESMKATLEFLREIYFKLKMMPEYEVYKKKLSEL